MVIAVPNEFGYVLLAASATFFVNSYHSILTSKARKASGIKYPTAYASAEVAEKDPKAFQFNCAQRAHANFTENLTPFLGELFIAGLRYPQLAASLGGVWAVARVFYAAGYTGAKGPAGRFGASVVSSLIDFVLKGTAAYAAVKFVLEQ
ncbi:hypothetical protein B0H66DRAFT_137092 [Apodospora peruviana]|uniref:Microsomal glutathione S-transferase 3 n=1 Tax=Apodospora peruviana TaxID=516989 RepID=A0AAE0IJ74_9PEZI|nr:hypothetical protein B0H66DRAFT_137092 [Apodospora peruviana]